MSEIDREPTRDDVADALDLTAEQVTKLRKKIEELEENATNSLKIFIDKEECIHSLLIKNTDLKCHISGQSHFIDSFQRMMGDERGQNSRLVKVLAEEREVISRYKALVEKVKELIQVTLNELYEGEDHEDLLFLNNSLKAIDDFEKDRS